MGLLCVEVERGVFQLQAWLALSRLQAALLPCSGLRTSSTFVRIHRGNPLLLALPGRCTSPASRERGGCGTSSIGVGWGVMGSPVAFQRKGLWQPLPTLERQN